MHCAGANCVLLSRSGYKCDVSPFLNSYEPQANTEIVKAATAFQGEDGIIKYIILPNALWFGSRMDHSLFNGLIAGDAGLHLDRDGRHPNRFTMKLNTVRFGKDESIPFTRRGNVVGVETFKPDKDSVLQAISNGSPDIIFLGPEEDYPPCHHVAAISGDLPSLDERPLLSDLQGPDDRMACASCDEAVLGWMHKVSEILTNRHAIHEGPSPHKRHRDSPEDEAEEEGDSPIHDHSFPGMFLVGAIGTGRHVGKVTPEALMEQWGIGIEAAKDTIKATTQLAIRNAIHPLRRRYRTDLLSLNYRRINEVVFSDTIFSKYEAYSKSTCAQVFATLSGAFFVYPLKSKSEAGEALRQFAEDVGVPNELVTDNASEMISPGTKFRETANFLRVKVKTIEPHTPRQNRAETNVAELRRRYLHLRQQKDIPNCLWDFGLKWVAETMTRSCRGTNERTGYEVVTGDTPDISEWIDFSFYDKVWFWHTPSTDQPAQPGRWLGVAHRVGSSLCYWILTGSGKIVARTTVQRVTDADMQSHDVQEKFRRFHDVLESKLSDKDRDTSDIPDLLYLEDTDIETATPFDGKHEFLCDVDDFSPDNGYDEYIGAEMVFSLEGIPDVRGTVVKRAKGESGNPLGKRHNNPMLDTREYSVQFADGSYRELTANLIAENLFSQVNAEGQSLQIFRGINGHRKLKGAVEKDDPAATIRGHTNVHHAKTTQGWEIRVEWRDGSTTWLPLSEVKAGNPVELADYAVLAKIDDEPAFRWWVPFVIKSKKRIVSKVKAKYWRLTHKFGIQLPKNVTEAYQIDKETNTTFWGDAIAKEMKKIKDAMTLYDGTEDDARKKLIGFQKINCHIIFDVKMEGLTRKARFVAGGHMTEAPKSMTFASVVTRESVRIAFLVAALNDLHIEAADVTNAYLWADCREKIYFIAGPEFGDMRGRVLIIRKALYGLKSSGAAWRSLFASTLRELGYKPTRADPDVWLRPARKPDGFEYYEMVLVYVDDILHLSHHRRIEENKTMQAVGRIYDLKPGSTGKPSRYLGANVGSLFDDTGKEMWFMSAADYIREAVKTIEADLGDDIKLRGRADRPFNQEYRPELDATPELNAELIQKFQGYIGILRWTVELGRVDIMTEVSLLSSYLVSPREGHLQAALHIFAYLRKHADQAMMFNPHLPDIDERQFQHNVQWSDVYGDVQEELPSGMPPPRGMGISLTGFVDADLAGNRVTRRSQTGFVIYGNCAPLLWYSKRQSTVECSTFGSEFVALRTCTESIIALRYKLRMFGVPLLGPANVFCDNGAVVNSSSTVEGRLNKKHLSLCYHRVRECCAANILRIAKVAGEDNVADLFTKLLPGPKRIKFVQQLLRHWKIKKTG